MKIIRSYFFEILFFIMLMIFQGIYFKISYTLDNIFISKDIFYLFLIETFLFVFYILFKEWCFYKKKWMELNVNRKIISELLDMNEKLIKNKSLLKTQENKFEELLDIIFGYVHHMKNPIAAIKMSNPDNNIKYDLLRIEEIVEKLLYTSRISDISNDLFINEYNLKDIVSGIIKKYKTIFISKKIILDFQVREEMVYTDYKWLTFALSQIISNALKYTDENGKITIKSRIINGKRVLEIIDTGCGISKEYQHRIFDKGFSVDHRNKKYKGTGIGLYISSKILKYLSIDYSVKSKVNEGTKFILYFKDKSVYFS